MDNNRLTEFTESHWDMLIDYISQGRVVPIIGPELLIAHDGASSISFYQLVMRRLAEYLSFPARSGENFDDFVLRYTRERQPMGVVRSAMVRILPELMTLDQPILDKLSAISSFKLFLTTTPDNLLFHSLIKTGGVEPEVCYFSRNYKKESDIPADLVKISKRYVYHLYGRSMMGVEYAVSEDERLDYSCSWMDSNNQPQNLIRYLSDKYLLVLGCGYENWLTRFFLYGLKGKGLFSNLESSSLLADSYAPTDLHICSFLERCRGNIYYKGGAAEFINELSTRLSQSQIFINPDNEREFMRDDVFISYATEDRAVALKIKSQLESVGISVWLDKYQLESGQDYERRINENIQNSSFFLPILSQTTATVRERRYFRKEWYWAEQEALTRSPLLPFVHPIAIDGVAPCDSINAYINKVHWVSAQDGKLDEEFIHRMKSLCSKI